MSPHIDIEAFQNQTFYGLDVLSMLGDIEDFIDFSESNIEWQKRRELRRTEQECSEVIFDDPLLAEQYHEHRIEGVTYRFDVSLIQRVRYAALASLITTFEWLFISLSNTVTFAVPKKPDRKNEAVHLLEVFNKQGSLRLNSQIKTLETLTQVRNCIIHSAGLLSNYKHGQALREALSNHPGIKISNINFLGKGIEIEYGYLQDVIGNAKQWLPSMLKTMQDNGLIQK